MNVDLDIDRVPECHSVPVKGLPLAYEEIRGERGGEDDLEGGLGPCAGGIESDLFGCAEGRSAGVPQAVARVPVAGAAVFDQPLLVDDLAKEEGRIIRNGDIRYELEVVDTLFRTEGRSGGGDRR